MDARRASEYLAFRYFLDSVEAQSIEKTPVICEEDVLSSLEENTRVNDAALFLSGGIDSGILACFVPPGTPAYTIIFDDNDEEVEMAKEYAEANSLKHHVISVCWDDYKAEIEGITRFKGAPLHPTEIALYIAARAVEQETIIIGIGADSNFGGLDKLLSREWTLEEFYHRYTFIEPELVLEDHVSVLPVYKKYVRGKHIETARFLEEIHGPGIIQTFKTALGFAGKKMCAPYEMMHYDKPLDLRRIRKGESKYVLREIFGWLYPGLDMPEKNPFSRPMDTWMADYKPACALYKDIEISHFSGEQKWLLYSLEEYARTYGED